MSADLRPAAHPGSMSARAWVVWTVAATAVICASVAALNAVVDPTAQLGTGVLEPVAVGPRDRAAKFELLQRGPMPDLVVLGSSRSKKIDPHVIDPSARRPVNAGVVGGDLFEARVYAAWLASRAASRHVHFPQLVVAVDVEQFRDSSLQGSSFLQIPGLAAVARREASGSSGSFLDELDRAERLLLTWQTTKASLASLRARRGAALARPGRDQQEQRAETFSPSGVPRSDAAWLRPTAAARFALRTPSEIERSVREYTATYEHIADELDPDAVRDLHALVELAHRADGPPPLLLITPSHPDFARRMAARGRAARLREVTALLRQIDRSGLAVFQDCSTCVDGRLTSWIDAVHPSPLGTRQLAARVAPLIHGPARPPVSCVLDRASARSGTSASAPRGCAARRHPGAPERLPPAGR